MDNIEQKIAEIHRAIGRMEAILLTVLNSYSKLMYLMLAIIAANLGLKFVGSPPWMIMAVYFSLLCSAFLLASVFAKRGKLPNRNKLIRVTFAVFVLFSAICRTMVFKSGVSPAPSWYSPVVDTFFVVLCIMFIYNTWRGWNIQDK